LGSRGCEFKASLVFIVSSRTATAIQKNRISKNRQTEYQSEEGTDLFRMDQGLPIITTSLVFMYLKNSILGLGM
jgi:hypothetical protein